ncbi:MAG: hypothetical protein QOI12_1543 [Alphaproteobacteria bacterium]|nr:hypothetical protein [Alphaproteobacteria bacterium]
MTGALGRFLALPWSEQRRTAEAAVWLLFVRLTFAVLPLPRALRLFGIVQGDASAGRHATGEAQEIGRAITRAAGHVPFRAVCLQQAFAALLMLRRRGLPATVRLGLARESAGGLKAHAWTCSGEVPVTGYACASDFVSVAAFSA